MDPQKTEYAIKEWANVMARHAIHEQLGHDFNAPEMEGRLREIWPDLRESVRFGRLSDGGQTGASLFSGDWILQMGSGADLASIIQALEFGPHYQRAKSTPSDEQGQREYQRYNQIRDVCADILEALELSTHFLTAIFIGTGTGPDGQRHYLPVSEGFKEAIATAMDHFLNNPSQANAQAVQEVLWSKEGEKELSAAIQRLVLSREHPISTPTIADGPRHDLMGYYQQALGLSREGVFQALNNNGLTELLNGTPSLSNEYNQFMLEQSMRAETGILREPPEALAQTANLATTTSLGL
jgi:hypothetical protein